MSDQAHQRRIPEWLILTIVFLCAVALVISRRPDAITNPQFFGEDGFWFSKVHDDGPLGALLAANPNRGYFYAVPMLGACLAMLVPLRYAPLVMNVIAIAIMAAPAVLICSSRFAASVPPLWAASPSRSSTSHSRTRGDSSDPPSRASGITELSGSRSSLPRRASASRGGSSTSSRFSCSASRARSRYSSSPSSR